MTTEQPQTSFWWMKSTKRTTPPPTDAPQDDLTPNSRFELEISSSMAEFLEKEKECKTSRLGDQTPEDIESIIEEINRLAAQSPLGPYEEYGDRSIEDIMKEAQQIYEDSSRSFELFGVRSKSPKDNVAVKATQAELKKPVEEPLSDADSYSEDFVDFDVNSPSPERPEMDASNRCESATTIDVLKDGSSIGAKDGYVVESRIASPQANVVAKESVPFVGISALDSQPEHKDVSHNEERFDVKEEQIKTLETENLVLRQELNYLSDQLSETKVLVEKLKLRMSSEENAELCNTREELKDAKEFNTALQLQLDNMSKTQQNLKINYEELATANKNLERRLVESDSTLFKYKNELQMLQEKRERLSGNESNLSRLLELERIQVKSLKTQTEKDSRSIQDLNRQVKEMERIIARKHPDSVSALIVAAKNDMVTPSETNRVLEDRIKQLESDAFSRDTQSSQVFLEIQDKFNQMKSKYESHIEDLELHVNDLKDQLKRKADTFDVYTQTFFIELQKIPSKDISSISVQTDPVRTPKTMVVTGKRQEKTEAKEETHLLATIRGLQSDLATKDKIVNKMQKEIDELRKTNRRLQKEREGSLKCLNEKEHKGNNNQAHNLSPESINNNQKATSGFDNDIKLVVNERDKLKLQLIRMEEDYTTLKTKRLQDLNSLQEAHEREIGTYIANISPLREQLEVQQVSLTTLQSQLSKTKEELAIVNVERDHLDKRLNNIIHPSIDLQPEHIGPHSETVQKKMACLEHRYAEREERLRAIVHGLAQKQITSRDCDQCAARQQQLIGYKAELDQLLATLRYLQ